MAAQKINFANKNQGDLFTETDVNTIKNTVNSHADDIDNISGIIYGNGQPGSGIAGAVDLHTQALNAVTARDSVVNKTPQVCDDIAPGPLYIWTNPVTSLTLTKVAGTAGTQQEYKLQFIVSGSEFNIDGSLMTDVHWLETPDWEDGLTYQVSIMNNLAIAAGWQTS